MDLAIIVPCYNRLPFTKIVVSHLVSMLSEDRPVILVDDGSTDGTDAWASAWRYSGKHVVSHVENKGLPVAYNAGFRRAKDLGCRVGVVVDNDVLVPFCFDKVLVEDLALLPRAIIGGLVYNDKNMLRWLHSKPDVAYKSIPFETPILGGGASVAIPVDAWDKVGGFHEGKGSFTYTDANFFGRARGRGWRTMIDPRLQCVELQQFAVTSLEYEEWKANKRFVCKMSLPAEGPKWEEFWRRWIKGKFLISEFPETPSSGG